MRLMSAGRGFFAPKWKRAPSLFGANLPLARGGGGGAASWLLVQRVAAAKVFFSTEPPSEKKCDVTGDMVQPGSDHMHFRDSKHDHPLNIQKTWQNPTQNHVWSDAEIEERMKEFPQHKPVTISDKIMHFIVKDVLYHGFNRLTGFDRTNPTARSCEWRLIILESVAGCPGMVAAGMRHFRSLRTLKRDHGWIHTLLEEAENERMHLLVCITMFKTGIVTRSVVILGQYFIVAFLMLTYVINPKALHRFVGYLEECATQTYADLIKSVNTPGTHLHKDWKHLKAPQIAKNYWRMKEDAMWVDVLRNLFADETNHRDVNHTFANMQNDDPNPYVKKHLADAAKAWRK
eukprot:CAMPEP_0170167160 /NCGR_PEP_ID=MMETSP0040_2-20121228/637_1 /TAXON_ID=641309 /ORGANISM="Lotharella oceanica, Strain CCMP622" /LENGTH=345 /DNA_ID=CAMNT_0010405089 /DNA_START=76 /DNA_END=1113 /DNA_ORIENTATION=+